MNKKEWTIFLTVSFIIFMFVGIGLSLVFNAVMPDEQPEAVQTKPSGQKIIDKLKGIEAEIEKWNYNVDNPEDLYDIENMKNFSFRWEIYPEKRIIIKTGEKQIEFKFSDYFTAEEIEQIELSMQACHESTYGLGGRKFGKNDTYNIFEYRIEKPEQKP